MNPSSENFARHIYEEMEKRVPPPVRVARVAGVGIRGRPRGVFPPGLKKPGLALAPTASFSSARKEPGRSRGPWRRARGSRIRTAALVAVDPEPPEDGIVFGNLLRTSSILHVLFDHRLLLSGFEEFERGAEGIRPYFCARRKRGRAPPFPRRDRTKGSASKSSRSFADIQVGPPHGYSPRRIESWAARLALEQGGGEPGERSLPGTVPRGAVGDPQGEDERFAGFPLPPFPQVGDVRRHAGDGRPQRLVAYGEERGIFPQRLFRRKACPHERVRASPDSPSRISRSVTEVSEAPVTAIGSGEAPEAACSRGEGRSSPGYGRRCRSPGRGCRGRPHGVLDRRVRRDVSPPDRRRRFSPEGCPSTKTASAPARYRRARGRWTRLA